jgi:hypothetical protein
MARLQTRAEEKQRADARTCLTPMVADGLVSIAGRRRRLPTFDRPVVRRAAGVFIHRNRTERPDRPIVSNIR